jgi:membrane-associated phospholipid phosphatase
VFAPAFVALLAAAGVYALYRVFVLTSLGQTVDTAALRGADVSHARAVEIMSRTLNGTSLVSLVLVCVAAAAIGMVRRRIGLAVAAALMVLGANLSAQLLKMRLDRPDLDGFPAPNSFPSGHTTAAVSVAFAMILVLPSAIRGMVSLVGAGYVSVIAVATVWAEWHRPSDTVAALLIVLAWSALSAFIVRLGRLRVPGPAERPSRSATLLLFVTGAVTGVVGALGLAAVVLSERVTPDLVSGRFAFLTGSAGIAAAVAGAFLIWARLATGDLPVPGSGPDQAAHTVRSPEGGTK